MPHHGIYAKIHDVPEEYDPDTDTTMHAAVEIELDVIMGTDIRCITTYVPANYTRYDIESFLQASVHTHGLPEGTPVTIIEYRHTTERVIN